MFEVPVDWSSFWDLTTPAEAAKIFREFYGPGAADAAAHCATAAKNDDRSTDYRFWLAVNAELNESDQKAYAELRASQPQDRQSAATARARRI
jgi:hypothetical protein